LDNEAGTSGIFGGTSGYYAVMKDATAAHEAYVREALTLQGFSFNEAQIAEIVLQFSRVATLAASLEAVELPPYFSAAPVFRP
jgi:hypothetical protein